MFGFPIQNKNSAINAPLTFLIDICELKKIVSRKINSKQKNYLYERAISLF